MPGGILQCNDWTCVGRAHTAVWLGLRYSLTATYHNVDGRIGLVNSVNR